MSTEYVCKSNTLWSVEVITIIESSGYRLSTIKYSFLLGSQMSPNIEFPADSKKNLTLFYWIQCTIAALLSERNSGKNVTCCSTPGPHLMLFLGLGKIRIKWILH